VFLGRVLAPGEPLWLDDDRAWAYALADVEAEICPCGCGQPMAESTAMGADEAYEAHVVTCHAGAAKERLVEGRNIPGALLYVRRVGDTKPPRR
jgi:hypothetical protein